MSEEDSNNNQPLNKKMYQYLIPIIAGSIALIIIAVILIGNIGKGNDSPNTATGSNTSEGKNTGSGSNSSGNKVYTPSELEKNVITSGAVTKHDKLVVFITNNNKIAVDMDIEVEFYNTDGVIVGSDDDSLKAVGAGAEIAVEMWDTPTSWDNYKIYVDLEQTDETSYFDKVELAHSNNGKEIAVQVKNNSEETIDYITVSVVYYQFGEVVGIDDSIGSEIKPGRSANMTLDYPYDSKYNNVKFDTYKVFITEAYSYNW